MPRTPVVVRNVPNLLPSANPTRDFKHMLAEKIVEGNLEYVQKADIKKTWFNKSFDGHHNKLVSFAAKIAIQKGVIDKVRSSGKNIVLSPWGNIFKHLVMKSVSFQVPVFTTAEGKVGYTVAHVIGNHSKSTLDAMILMSILEQHSGKNGRAMSREMTRKFNAKYSPGGLGQRRGVVHTNGTNGSQIANLLRARKVGSKANVGALTKQLQNMKLQVSAAKRDAQRAEAKANELYKRTQFAEREAKVATNAANRAEKQLRENAKRNAKRRQFKSAAANFRAKTAQRRGGAARTSSNVSSAMRA